MENQQPSGPAIGRGIGWGLLALLVLVGLSAVAILTGEEPGPAPL